MARTLRGQGARTFRRTIATLDSLGRVRVVRTPGLDSVVYGYDARGRLQQVQTGGRVASCTYDGAGRLATTTDPLGRTDSLFYDGADRLIRQLRPQMSQMHADTRRWHRARSAVISGHQ